MTVGFGAGPFECLAVAAVRAGLRNLEPVGRLDARAGCRRRLADFTMDETSSLAVRSCGRCGHDGYSSRTPAGQLAKGEDCDDDDRQCSAPGGCP